MKNTSHTIFSLMKDTLQWTVLFALCSAPVEQPSIALLTVGFALLLSTTIPLSLADLRVVFLAEASAKQPATWRQRPVELIETLVLLLAIIFGAVFTQLDWAQWFLVWPFPSVLAYSVVGIAVAMARRRRSVGSKKRA